MSCLPNAMITLDITHHLTIQTSTDYNRTRHRMHPNQQSVHFPPETLLQISF